MILEVRQKIEVHFLFGTVILGLLSIFKKSQASSPYAALNSVCLSTFQRDVRRTVQMRRKLMAFCSVSTGDSDMPSFCEMKHEPEFKPLQENRAFFWVRASRGIFHLRQKIQCPSHIPTPEENSSWGACGKLAHLFSERQGIVSHFGTIFCARSFPCVAALKLMFIETWDRCLSWSL